MLREDADADIAGNGTARPHQRALRAAEPQREPETQPQARADARSERDAKPDDKDDEKAEPKEPLGARLRKHWVWVLIGAIVPLAAIVAGVLWYLDSRHYESTDDAFIDGRSVAISPQVSGAILKITVNDNQVVHKGDLLAEIDARDYTAAVGQADAMIAQGEASIASANAQIEAQKAQIDQAGKQVEEAQAALSFAKDQDARAQDLVKKGAGTVQNAQQTASDLAARQAAFWAANSARSVAQRQIAVLEAQVKTGEAQVAQAQAQKAAAEANLSRTQIRSTLDGRVARLTAAPGALATPGQALMIIVPSELWVTANFKETQLADMRKGQEVDIQIDAFKRSFPGHVDSIQPGSGTAFSLLPAENATGNFVKVVQRVPVKVTFDQTPDLQIGPGMSVVPRVRVR